MFLGKYKNVFSEIKVHFLGNRRMFYFAQKYVISITYGAKWGKEEAAAT